MKNELRKKYLEIRNNIINKEEKDNIIFNKVINNVYVKNAKTILIYVSINSEVDTKKLIAYFLKNKKVAVPKIENNTMNFYYINSLNDLKIGTYYILEPTTNIKVTDFKDTISITPGICFSKDNYRIGYGKGYYDKFYSKHNIYSIGLCYKECLIENFTKDKYDIKINAVISDEM